MLRNTFNMTLSTLARLATNVVLFVVLARYWGPGPFGIFMYPFTIASLAAMVVDYGYSLQIIRDVGKSPAEVQTIVNRGLQAKLHLTLLLCTASFALFFIADANHFRILTWTLTAAAIANSFALYFNFPLRGLNRFDVEAKVTIASNVVLFLTVIALALAGSGPMGVALGFLAARLFYLALSLYCYGKVAGSLRFSSLDFGAVLAILKGGLPFGVHVAIGALYFQVDTLVVQHFVGAEGVGVYQAAMRVLMGGLFFAEVLNSVYLAAMARASDNREEMIAISTRMTKHLLIVGGAGFVVMAAGAPLIVDLLYGARFKQAAELLPLFGIVLLLRYFNVSYGLILTVANKQFIRMLTLSASFLASIGLNILVIPSFGLTGAAYVSIATHLLISLVYVFFARCEVKALMINKRAFALICLCGIYVVVMTTLLHVSATGTIQLAIGVLFLLVIAVIGIEREEYVFLHGKLLQNRGN